MIESESGLIIQKTTNANDVAILKTGPVTKNVQRKKKTVINVLDETISAVDGKFKLFKETIESVHG